MNVEEQIKKDGFALVHTVGDSMEPLLHQHKEESLIRQIERELLVGDVILYKRENGQYLLHRIVKKKKIFFITRGDNRFINEKVVQSQIIGILKGFYRDDVFVDCETDKEYIAYVKKLRVSYPLRFVLDKLKMVKRKITK